MKRLLVLCLAVLSLTSCSRLEHYMAIINPPVDTATHTTNCIIVSQTFTSTPEPSGHGFAKTFGENGNIESVRAVSNGPNIRDSIFFTFGNIAPMEGYDSAIAITFFKQTFSLSYNEETGDTTMEVVTDNLDFWVAYFDNAKKLREIGPLHGPVYGIPMIFNYNDKNELVHITNPASLGSEATLTYDANGNLTKFLMTDEYKNNGIEYEYDMTKTAATQLYITSGSWISDKYHFAEIMGWVASPKNLRTTQTFTGEENGFTFEFTNHVVNENGVLTSFEAKNTSTEVASVTIENATSCTN